MSRLRLWVAIASIIIGLLIVLFLVTNLHQLYSSIATTSVLLANIILTIALLLFIVCIAIAGYYFYLFSRKSRSTNQPEIILPSNKLDVAEETLIAARKQVQQIQDEISRQSLLEQSQRIEKEFQREYFHVVVFGTGSAGKTSIVNAVLGRRVGDVNAIIGTTTTEKTYRFKFKNLDGEIWITDTPGIEEASVIGTEREERSRYLATESDLLIFVIDNDLRHSEFVILQQLVDIGKRSILVLNKVDLFPDDDLNALLNRIRDRVQPFLDREDVVGIAANPSIVAQADGDPIHPSPYLIPLLRRMVQVLHNEGDDLIADNILLQAQRLTNEAQQVLIEQRCQNADAIVERFQWISGGVVSLMPLPVVDLLATAAINAQMVVELGKVYDCEISVLHAKELAVSLAKTLIGLGIVKGAIELSTLTLQLNPGTILIGQAVQGVTAAYLTRIAGKSFMTYFQQNQTWGDGGISAVVQKQFQLNRRDDFIKTFVADALNRMTLSSDDP